MPLPAPRADLVKNTYEFETLPLVKPAGFREYDARWLLDKEINLLGLQALGLALGTYIHEVGVQPRVVVGHDFRAIRCR
jgi:phosphomannomutase/phosphoglucomutase